MTRGTEPRELRIKRPTDLLAAVPWVLGFHPEHSLVLLWLGGAPGPHLRCDLPADVADIPALLACLEPATRSRPGPDSRRVALALYTADHALASAVVEAVEGAGAQVAFSVRAYAGRWFCLTGCGGDGCDPAGTAYDLTCHPWTARAVLAGQVIQASREEVASGVQPPGDAAGEADRAAVEAAVEATLDRAEVSREWLVAEGRWVRQRVRRFLADGQTLTVEDAARMLLVLLSVEVRDVAWAEMDRENALRHVALWRHLLRRAPDDLAAPPAALLGFAAWLGGDGALAWCAVERCQEVAPDYRLASLLVQALAGALPPECWQPFSADDLPLFAG